jgi:hypothetical protein
MSGEAEGRVAVESTAGGPFEWTLTDLGARIRTIGLAGGTLAAAQSQ